MSENSSETSTGKIKLSRFAIFSYGLPRFGNSMMYLAIAIYLPKFFADTLLLGAAYIGWIFLLGRCWDGITDPLMGYISDNTKWKMGRRRPYFLISAVPLAVAFSMLWSPPESLEGSMLFLYLAVTFMLTYTCWTVFSVPYNSLGAEMTMDYHERTVLTGVREAFGLLGTMAATMILYPSVVVRIYGDQRTGYANLSMGMGIVTAALIVIAFFSLKENPEFQRRRSVHAHRQYARTYC